MKKFISYIKQTAWNLVFRVLACISPRLLASVHYWRGFHRKLNWKHPQDINEKINWLKFNTDTTLWTDLTDKYKVREFVKSKGLESMLVKLYGKWDDAETIDWESLPNQFVLKPNNGSADVFICRNKAELDIPLITSNLSKSLNHHFGDMMGEPHYNRIHPCIIAEELLDSKKQPMHSTSIIDYKIWSFDGKPAYVWVCRNRTHHSVEVGVYDLDWNFHPEYSVSTSHYVLANELFPRPQTLDQMLKAASILSEGFPELRVDLYEVDNKPYFGELTFTSASGLNDFYTPQFLMELGRLCDISHLCK